MIGLIELETKINELQRRAETIESHYIFSEMQIPAKVELKAINDEMQALKYLKKNGLHLEIAMFDVLPGEKPKTKIFVMSEKEVADTLNKYRKHRKLSHMHEWTYAKTDYGFTYRKCKCGLMQVHFGYGGSEWQNISQLPRGVSFNG